MARTSTLLAAVTFVLTAAAPAQSPTWKLSSAPTLVIGSNADIQKEFQAITGIARGANGNIAVVNEGSHNVRVFDASGKFLRAYGAQGSGAGQFENARLIGRAGDSLFIFDPANHRLSVVSMNGGYKSVRVMPSVGDQATLKLTGRFSSGALLAMPTADVRLEHRDGTYRDSIRPGIIAAPPSQAVEWLGTFPSITYFAFNPANAPRAKSIGVYRYGGSSSFVVSGDVMWYGNSEVNDLQQFNHLGKVVSHAKVPWESRAFNDVKVASAQQQAVALARNDASKAYMQALYSAKYRPKNEPLFGSMIAAPNGGVWVARFNAEIKSATEYAVLDKTGKTIARVTLPPAFTPQEIGPDYVLGIARADDGIETVVMYKLQH